ncbi:MAG: SUMF1/EgtB/PvdO family nonheme iron enzyme [Gemmatimonadales bacterium]|nr:SUMF1/EgtB/PvdO family nonheme iron enzyme [Gemmatimonadales bacterium]
MTEPPVDELSARLQEALGESYEVRKPLGAGGFAVVYLVLDRNLKRKLAVKVLSPDLITSKTVLERFRREAETVAQLSHPHIVPLHFIGQKDDLLYLAMECIEGGSLADRIEREGKLPVDEAARILAEVASALDYAHKRGVVHRDIKPHNVLLQAETGRSLVTDFGIARTQDGGSLTATGMLVGTPTYMSPEQVTGEPTDHMADLYALGIVAYEMLAGVPPFSGPTPTVVLMKRVSEPPPSLRKLRPDVPEELGEIVDTMLAQDRNARFQSGGDIVRALGGATPAAGMRATMELAARKQRRMSSRRTLVAGAGLGVVLIGAAVAILARKEPVVVLPVDPGMVVIEGGSYTIGSDAGLPRSRPAHRVGVDTFAIDVAEVTVGQYAEFVAAGHAAAPWIVPPDSALPVTGVRHQEAMDYCAWRHPPAGRLPTEVEWEAAARGLGGRLFPWGNAWASGAANTESALRRAPSRGGSHPGGVTPEGVKDMVGNVWEWTSTPMGAYPGGESIPNVSQYFVIRGGAYDSPDSIATPTYRGYLAPAAERPDLNRTGFRCVMPLRRATGR